MLAGMATLRYMPQAYHGQVLEEDNPATEGRAGPGGEDGGASHIIAVKIDGGIP